MARRELEGAGEAAPTGAGVVVGVAARGPATLTEVVRRLDAASIEPTGLQLRQPSLDDVFLALTGSDTTTDTTTDAEDAVPAGRRKRRGGRRAEEQR